MSCCTKTYNLGCFNNCSIIAVGLCENSGTYNGIFTYGNISTTITVTAIVNEPFLFDLSLLNENATFTLAIYDENENQITLTIDSVDYDCFKVKTQVDSVKVTQGTIIGCTPMCKEIYDPNDENTAVLFTVAVDGTTITGDGTAGNPLIAIGGGGGGGIESIVAGDNITVDDTDPLNPIVSASSSLFPNGQEIVTESRDFRDSDIGKILIVVGNDITLTMPDSIVFSEQLRTIGLVFLKGYTGCGYQPSHGFTTKVLQLPNDGEFITLITGEYLGKSSVGSIANMQVNSDDGIVTLNKYLYDQSQNVIPLSGTEVGKPVTGDIDFANANIIFNNIDGDKFIKFGFNTATDETGLYFDNGLDPQTRFSIYNGDIQCYMPIGSYFSFANDYLGFSNNGNSSFVGIRGGEDYSNIITDLDYTQKIYVDSLATSKQDTLVSGTNIKTINGTTILGSGDMTVGGQVDILQIQMFI